MKYFLQKIYLFYREHPISQYALAQISGTLFGLNNIFGLFFLLFLIVTTKSKNILFLVLLFFSPLPIIQNYYKIPKKNSYIKGEGIFIPYSQSLLENKLWKIQGKLIYFTNNYTKEKHRNISCCIFFHKKLSLYKNYKVLGKLINKNIHYYVLQGSIKLIKNKKNLKSFGLFFNKKISKKIDQHFKNSEVNSFLKSIFLGHPLTSEIKQNFQKLGISHMLIISGFHFSFIISISSIIFYCLPYKLKLCLIFIVITSFMIILHPSPSITRAWTSYTLTLIAAICSRSCSNITKLSFSSLVILTINPLNILNISFQFSFLSTLGIILFHPFIKEIFFINSNNNLSKLKKILINAINTLINYLSITISSQVFIIPLLITNFHKLYLGTFFYNILFSPLIQISIILFVLSYFLQITLLFPLVSKYISWVLYLTINPPILFKTIWVTSKFSNYWFFFYFILFFCTGILIFLKKENTKITYKKYINI